MSGLKYRIDWSAARASYLADPSLSLRDIADQFGVPRGTVCERAARERWTAGRTRVPRLSTDPVQLRLRELVAEIPRLRPIEIYEILSAEFGAAGTVPSIRTIARRLEPRQRDLREVNEVRRGRRVARSLALAVVEPTPVSLDGVRRRCLDGCGGITAADPCEHCGTEAGR